MSVVGPPAREKDDAISKALGLCGATVGPICLTFVYYSFKAVAFTAHRRRILLAVC